MQRFKRSIFDAPMLVRNGAAGQMMLASETFDRRWHAVHELCAEFYWGGIRLAQRMNAPAAACPRFQHNRCGSASGQFAGCRQTGRSGPDNDHTMSHGFSALAVPGHRLVDLLE